MLAYLLLHRHTNEYCSYICDFEFQSQGECGKVENSTLSVPAMKEKNIYECINVIINSYNEDKCQWFN